MTVVKVRSKKGVEGVVAVENWADPGCYLMDFQFENGDITPVEREGLEYIGIEELQSV